MTTFLLQQNGYDLGDAIVDLASNNPLGMMNLMIAVGFILLFVTALAFVWRMSAPFTRVIDRLASAIEEQTHTLNDIRTTMRALKDEIGQQGTKLAIVEHRTATNFDLIMRGMKAIHAKLSAIEHSNKGKTS